MKIIFTSLFFLFSVTTFAQIPPLAWVKQLSGTSNEVGNDIAVDNLGNVYTTGYFSGTVDFDPGVGNFDITSIGIDVFVSKLDSDGNFIWAKSFGSVSANIGYSITVDDTGNVFTTGYMQGTVDFDPNGGVYNLTSVGLYDIFISKLDSNGNFIWAKNMGGDGITEGLSIALDDSGNVYTTGYYGGTTDFDPDATIYNLTAISNHEVFISKLDMSGSFVWAKRIGANNLGDIYGYGIAVDDSNNIYTTGFFSGTVDFDPNALSYNLTSNGAFDIFISKLDGSGNFIWGKNIGSNLNDQGFGIAVDDSFNVYTSGMFQGTGDFDPNGGIYNLTSVGSSDVFISKLNSNGDFVWANRAGGAMAEIGYGITIDDLSNVLITGYSQILNTNHDVFISKLNSNGIFDWSFQMGGTGTDEGNSIAVDGIGNIYTTGIFQTTVDFDPAAGILNLSSAGSGDVFIHKLGFNCTIQSTIQSSGNLTFCSGDNVTLTANTGTGYLYQWQLGGVDISGATNANYTTDTAGSYTVTISNSSGCSAISATTLVVVNPLPIVTVNPITICSGVSGTLTAFGANTYNWSPSIGLSATTGSSVSANPTITSTYTLIGFNSSTCSDTVTVVVTVTTEPTVIVDSITICNGSSGTLTATSSSTYTWSPSTGLNVTTGATVTVNPTVTTSYTVTGTSSCGTTTAVALVTVAPLPSVTVNPITICFGLSGALSASGATSYTWTPSTGLSGTTGSTVTANPTITTTYIVVGSNTATCSDTATVVVTVNSVPIVNVNSISICNGASGTLTATSSDTYTWSPSVGLNVTTGASITASPTITTSYTVTGTGSCGTTTAVAVVTVLPSPTAKAGEDVSLCGSDSVQLNATGGLQYTWSPSIGLSDVAIENPFANPSTTTTYTVIVTDADGCTASDEIIVRRNGETCFFIPSVFTPNNDGTNDTWEIPGLNSYSNCSVKVFNRWGQLLFSSIGYSQPWDGTYVGNKLPVADYYYIIDLKDGTPAFTGTVTVKL